jgi:ankyrin repeat protein
MHELRRVTDDVDEQRQEQLVQAIKRKRVKAVEDLLAFSPELVNESFEFGKGDSTPLALAADSGHLGMVRALLASKADVNSLWHEPCSCCQKLVAANVLFIAATKGHYRMVVELLQVSGVELRGMNSRGDRALLILARNFFFNGQRIIDALLAADLVDPNVGNKTSQRRHLRGEYMYPLTQAAVLHKDRMVQSLLQHKASIHKARRSLSRFKPSSLEQDYYFDKQSKRQGLEALGRLQQRQNRCLRVAVKAGDVALVTALVEQEADYLAHDFAGNNAVDLALKKGRGPMMGIFCQNFTANFVHCVKTGFPGPAMSLLRAYLYGADGPKQAGLLQGLLTNREVVELKGKPRTDLERLVAEAAQKAGVEISWAALKLVQ